MNNQSIENCTNYLQPYRSVGAGVIDPTTQQFNDIGLLLSLKSAYGFFDSLKNLISLFESNFIEIKNIDTNLPLTEIGELFQKHRSDKSGPTHRYDLVYQNICSCLRTKKSLSILEIGLGSNDPQIVSHMGQNHQIGASLFAFREFFPNAFVYGADIDKKILFTDSRIKCSYVDQLEPKTFNSMHNELGCPELDLFVEDGLHSVTTSLNSLNYAISAVKKGGYIVLEDLYNPHQIWQTLCMILKQYFNFEQIQLINSGGLMLVIKV
jgi:hypothetical protein